jgi:hypothetical protein
LGRMMARISFTLRVSYRLLRAAISRSHFA